MVQMYLVNGWYSFQTCQQQQNECCALLNIAHLQRTKEEIAAEEVDVMGSVNIHCPRL